MATKDRYGVYGATALFLALVLVLGALHGCKQEEPNAVEEPTSTENPAPTTVAQTTTTDPLEAVTSVFREPKADLQNVIKAAQTWYPGFEQWQGEPAPDFTLADIEGNSHKLSEYRGKDVVVVFWATWCGPCKLEVPHLKELRETLGQDKLAILAISREPEAIVKAFAEEQELNYTVLTSPGDLPAPFGEVQAIPSSFFVDAEGRIKLGVIGIVPTADAKAILQAQ